MTAITLADLATRIDATLEGDGTQAVTGPASLREAGPTEVSFLAQSRYASQLVETNAAAVVVAEDYAVDRDDIALLRCKDPNSTFTAVIQAFSRVLPAPPAGIHPTAVVDPAAEVDPTAYIGPLSYVAAGARIASSARLVSGVHVGPKASVGAQSILHPGVVLYESVTIGERCVVHSGCVVGSDGYGFEPSKTCWIKVPQCGTVIVEDDVELGANVTIDRARFGATRIGRGAKLDNLVHVAHNVLVGENVLLVAQVGVSGSTHIGPWAILGGKVGVAGHVDIGQGARVGGGSDVFSDVPAGMDFLGSPARERMQTLRAQAGARRIPKVLRDLRSIEERLDALDAQVAKTEAGE